MHSPFWTPTLSTLTTGNASPRFLRCPDLPESRAVAHCLCSFCENVEGRADSRCRASSNQVVRVIHYTCICHVTRPVLGHMNDANKFYHSNGANYGNTDFRL